MTIKASDKIVEAKESASDLSAIDEKRLEDGDFPSPGLLETDGAGNYQIRGIGTAEGQVAPLEVGGKLPESVIPALALTDLFVVADIAERDALVAQQGDIAIVTGTADESARTENMDINGQWQLEAAGQYFSLWSPFGFHVFWFSIDGAGAEPVVAGALDYTEISILSSDTDTQQASKTQLAIDGHPRFSATYSSGNDILGIPYFVIHAVNLIAGFVDPEIAQGQPATTVSAQHWSNWAVTQIGREPGPASYIMNASSEWMLLRTPERRVNSVAGMIGDVVVSLDNLTDGHDRIGSQDLVLGPRPYGGFANNPASHSNVMMVPTGQNSWSPTATVSLSCIFQAYGVQNNPNDIGVNQSIIMGYGSCSDIDINVSASVIIGSQILMNSPTTPVSAYALTAVGMNAGKSGGQFGLRLGYSAGEDDASSYKMYLAAGPDNNAKENTWIYGDRPVAGTFNIEFPNGGLTIRDNLVSANSPNWDTAYAHSQAPHTILGAMEKHHEAEHGPDSVTVTNGTITGGNVASLQTIDGDYLVVNETGRFTIDMVYSGLEDEPSRLNIFGRYEGSVSHDVKVRAYNYSTLLWDDLTADAQDISYDELNPTEDKCFSFIYPSDSANYFNAGESQVRIEHDSNDSIAHNMYLDCVLLLHRGLDFPTANTWIDIKPWTGHHSKNFAGVDLVNGTLTIPSDGDYSVDFLIDGEINEHTQVDVSVFLNDVENSVASSQGYLTRFQDGHMRAQALRENLTAGDVLKLRAKSRIGGRFVTIHRAEFRARKEI